MRSDGDFEFAIELTEVFLTPEIANEMFAGELEVGASLRRLLPQVRKMRLGGVFVFSGGKEGVEDLQACLGEFAG